MSLNRQGRIVALGSVGLLAAGRLLGLLELFVLGATGLALVLAALLVVVRARPLLAVRRDLHPPRVHAGTHSRVDLSVTNAGSRRTGVLALHDPVTNTNGANLRIGPLVRGSSLDGAYELPTQRRGIVRAGPLRAIASDPFGLAQRSFLVADVAELTVLPRIENIVPLPHTVGRDDPHAGADHPNALGQGGEDFYALRQYVVGDDLRRVHWASTAHRGELMVRQEEVPWQGRATILLDTRRHTTSEESFELAVSATASIVTASARHRELVRVVTCAGTDTGYADGHAQVDAVMEQLAVVERSRAGSLRQMLALLERSPGGALVAVTAMPSDDDVDALVRLRGRFGKVTVIMFDRSTWDAEARRHTATLGASPTMRVLCVPYGQSFAEGWNRAMTPSRAGAISGRRERGG